MPKVAEKLDYIKILWEDQQEWTQASFNTKAIGEQYKKRFTPFFELIKKKINIEN